MADTWQPIFAKGFNPDQPRDEHGRFGSDNLSSEQLAKLERDQPRIPEEDRADWEQMIKNHTALRARFPDADYAKKPLETLEEYNTRVNELRAQNREEILNPYVPTAEEQAADEAYSKAYDEWETRSEAREKKRAVLGKKRATIQAKMDALQEQMEALESQSQDLNEEEEHDEEPTWDDTAPPELRGKSFLWQPIFAGRDLPGSGLVRIELWWNGKSEAWEEQPRDEHGRFGEGGYNFTAAERNDKLGEQILPPGEADKISDIGGTIAAYTLGLEEDVATGIHALRAADAAVDTAQRSWNGPLAALHNLGVDTSAAREELERIRTEIQTVAPAYKEALHALHNANAAVGDLSLVDPEEVAFVADPDEEPEPEPPDALEDPADEDSVAEWGGYREEHTVWQQTREEGQAPYAAFKAAVKTHKAKEKEARIKAKVALKASDKLRKRLEAAMEKLSDFGDNWLSDLVPYEDEDSGYKSLLPWYDGKAWNHADHPRDARGRFIGVSEDRAKEIRTDLERTRGSADPKEVAGKLAQMTTAQLRQLKADLGVKSGRLKRELTEAVAKGALERAMLREIEALTTEGNKWGTSPGQQTTKTAGELAWEAKDAAASAKYRERVAQEARERATAPSEAERQAAAKQQADEVKARLDRMWARFGVEDVEDEEPEVVGAKPVESIPTALDKPSSTDDNTTSGKDKPAGAKAVELPKLTGSEKQVTWANDIRNSLASSAGHSPRIKHIADAMVPVLGSELAKLPADAKWWIDNKKDVGFPSLFASRFGLTGKTSDATEAAGRAYRIIEDRLNYNAQRAGLGKPGKSTVGEDDTNELIRATGSREKASEIASAFGFSLYAQS